MITKITNIKKFDDKLKGAYGASDPKQIGQLLYTYFSKKTIQYWKYRGLKKIKVGMKINVFSVPNTNHFKIIAIERENGEYL